MSLKAFHLIFVTLLTALSFGCAAWAFQSGSLAWGLTGIAAGTLGWVYSGNLAPFPGALVTNAPTNLQIYICATAPGYNQSPYVVLSLPLYLQG